MAQVVQHNIMALNSYNKLSTNNSALSKNLEKLSSGYRINRAADDAAGLAISEKMRAQITGLEKAAANAQDGISLVQTAEGALTEVHSMLNRMYELATQSANGTYQDEVDRENLQAEVDALLEEIDRIANNTNFNGINLLDGSATAAKIEEDKAPVYELELTVGTISNNSTFTFAGETITFKTSPSASAMEVKTGLTGKDLADAIAAKLNTSDKFEGYTVTASDDGKKLIITGDDEKTEPNDAFEGAATGAITGTGKIAGDEESDNKNAKITIDLTGVTAKSTSDDVKLGGVTLFTASTSKPTVEKNKDDIADNIKDKEFEIDGKKYTGTFDSTTLKLTLTAVEEGETGVDASKVIASLTNVTDTTKLEANDIDIEDGSAGGGEGTFSLQIGDTVKQRLTFSIASMDTKSLGIDEVDIGTEAGAAKALDTIKSAINSVSMTRANLGAVQNRLEHTITNLETTTENLTNAESSIRDTDMAKEMMEYTKNNVLSQAAQAMLAQANQQPQQVLQLLQ